MGRKPLGYAAIVLGLLGVAFFALLLVVPLAARGAVRDWSKEYLEPADRAVERLVGRLSRSEERTASTEEEVAGLLATGAERVFEALRKEAARLQLDLIALESSVESVDASMEVISALPLFEERRRGFREAVTRELAGIREELSKVEARLEEGRALAARAGTDGEGGEEARAALRELAREITPTIVQVGTFLADLGAALAEVRARLGEAHDRVGRILTTATVVICLLCAWLAIAHWCVFLAGRRLLEEDARLGGDSIPDPPKRV